MLQRLEFHSMGCEMLAVVDSETPSTQLPQVPLWFEEWEQTLSRFRYDSELTRLNQTHDQPVQVSETLWQVFQAVRNAEAFTNGLVTPTLLDSIIAAGYDRPFDMLPHQTAFQSASTSLTSPTLEAIRFDDSSQTITLPFGMGLDFGGVAKGWAAHQALKQLQDEGAALSESKGPALINAGGDIAISGPRADGSLWQVGVANPFQPNQEIEVLYLNQNGVATSGKNHRRWLRDGLLQHHILDPLTGQPAETDLMTVTVIAPDVLQAEAAAKAAFILGSHAGLKWIESQAELAGLLILDNGEILYSSKMEEYL